MIHVHIRWARMIWESGNGKAEKLSVRDKLRNAKWEGKKTNKRTRRASEEGGNSQINCEMKKKLDMSCRCVQTVHLSVPNTRKEIKFLKIKLIHLVLE